MKKTIFTVDFANNILEDEELIRPEFRTIQKFEEIGIIVDRKIEKYQVDLPKWIYDKNDPGKVKRLTEIKTKTIFEVKQSQKFEIEKGKELDFINKFLNITDIILSYNEINNSYDILIYNDYIE